MSPSEAVAIALDLGGTDLKSALVSRDGAIERFSRRPSRTTESATAPLDALIEAVTALRHGVGATVGVGVGCPGAIDPTSGRLLDRTAHLPHWRDFPLGETLADRLGLPVAVDNDANLAALAEHRLGAARDARVAIVVTLGTGIGCGIVIDGRIHHGAAGGAGELGHVPLGREGRACACGIPDCVEPEASGGGLAEDARRLGLSPAGAEAIFAAAVGGDVGARAALARCCDRLGAAIATAVDIINPEVVVVGGRVAEAGDILMRPLRAAVDRYALPSHRRGLRVVAASLGERAGVAGAGLLAWEAAAGRR